MSSDSDDEPQLHLDETVKNTSDNGASEYEDDYDNEEEYNENTVTNNSVDSSAMTYHQQQQRMQQLNQQNQFHNINNAIQYKQQQLSGTSAESSDDDYEIDDNNVDNENDSDSTEIKLSSASSIAAPAAATTSATSATSLFTSYDVGNDSGGSSSTSSSLPSSMKPPIISDNYEPSNKKYKIEETIYSDKSWRMMKQMGYNEESGGLGKFGQGIVNPIEPSKHKGRRGLGLAKDDIEMAGDTWNEKMETITEREYAEWLINDDPSTELSSDLTRDVLDTWIKLGDRKLTIADETEFCDPDILQKLLQSKSIFDTADEKDMRGARSRSNPFENIRSAIFLNRAAVKMANMDAIFDYMFTNPVDEYNQSLITNDTELLYFADVCAGPGGFSEYVLWRNKWNAKGFGFTLRGAQDFDLQNFLAGHPETFDTYYGIQDDGNIYVPANIESFGKYVLSKTDGKGVHFMMADGGFSVEGEELVQEVLSKQLYLCQCLVGLNIVRENGHFLCKLFDTFTPFSVGLIYLMFKCFRQICIVKPNTTRPANSERYLICKWKKSNSDVIYRHLFDINKEMYDISDPDNTNMKDIDTLELVPLHILKNDEKFFDYIFEHNNRLAWTQIGYLLKIAAYIKDKALVDIRQSEYREKSLKLWDIPDTSRKAITKKSNDQLCNDLLGPWSSNKIFLTHPGLTLNNNVKLENAFPSKLDWYFIPLDTIESSGKNVRTFFMSKGGRNVLMYINGTWREYNDLLLDITPETFIYGEIVKELKGEGRLQTIMYALHIIDGMVLGGTDIRFMPYSKRIKMCQKFARAINKPTTVIKYDNKESESIPLAAIRCKQIYPLQQFSSFFENLALYKLKDGSERYGISLKTDDDLLSNIAGDRTVNERFYVPHGLLFYNEIKSNLRKVFSKRTGNMYYFDTLKNCSFYADDHYDPNSIYASFRNTFISSYIWPWACIYQVFTDCESKKITKDPSLLCRDDIAKFIESQ